MPLTTFVVPDPPPATDWRYVIPGQYVETIVGVIATLTAAGGCAPLNPHTVAHAPATGVNPGPNISVGLAGFDPGAGAFTVEMIVHTDPAGVLGNLMFSYGNTVFVPGRAIINFRVGVDRAVVQIGGAAQISFAAFYPGTFNPQRWHHFALTCSGTGVGTTDVYLDGVLIGSQANPVYAQGARNGSRLNTFQANPQPALGSGYYSDVSLYHAKLTGAQVAAHAALYCADLAAYRAAVLADLPVTYWVLGDPALSPTVADATGNGHLGTVNAGMLLGAVEWPQILAPRAVNLEVAAPVLLVGAYPPLHTQPQANITRYTWFPVQSQNVPVPGADVQTVAIPHLTLPAGYLFGTVTRDFDQFDQWSDISVWFDYSYSAGGGGLPPVNYRDLLILG